MAFLSAEGRGRAAGRLSSAAGFKAPCVRLRAGREGARPSDPLPQPAARAARPAQPTHWLLETSHEAGSPSKKD